MRNYAAMAGTQNRRRRRYCEEIRAQQCQQWSQISYSVPALGWNRTEIVAPDFSTSKNRTAPNPQLFGWLHNFANSDLWLQLGTRVVILSQYYVFLKDIHVHGRSPPNLQNVIQSQFLDLHCKIAQCQGDFTATQQIVIGSHIGESEVTEYVTLHHLHIYNTVIR